MLEDQQCNWLPGEKSPDRLDACVWGFTKLIVDAGPSAQSHLDYATRYAQARLAQQEKAKQEVSV